MIELMIVIAIIGLLAATLLPALTSNKVQAYIAADQAQLRTHFSWLQIYQQKHKQALPMEGGYKFVLSTWTEKTFDHTEENLDKYFTPGLRDNDPDYRLARGQIEKGNDPWPDLNSTRTQDTHYVGRAKDKIKSATMGENEAWMANDNEGLPSFPDGTVNVLFGGGAVRSYSWPDLKERFNLGDFDKNAPPIETWGPNSPIPECRSLAN